MTDRRTDRTIARARPQLRLHVEQYDQTAALEQVTATGASKPRTEVYLSPFNDALPALPELHHPLFVFKPQKAAFESPA